MLSYLSLLMSTPPALSNTLRCALTSRVFGSPTAAISCKTDSFSQAQIESCKPSRNEKSVNRMVARLTVTAAREDGARLQVTLNGSNDLTFTLDILPGACSVAVFLNSSFLEGQTKTYYGVDYLLGLAVLQNAEGSQEEKLVRADQRLKFEQPRRSSRLASSKAAAGAEDNGAATNAVDVMAADYR